MPSFIGTNANETITTTTVSPSVTKIGAPRPSNAADSINGGGGNDTIDAGGGNDVVRGGTGNDTIQLGAGDDIATWIVGDGAVDLIDGGADTDRLFFIGAAGADTIDVFSNAGLRILRGGEIVGAQAVEQVVIRTLAGGDIVNLGDLGGTTVSQITVDLAGTSGGSTPDGSVDSVVVSGTNTLNSISLSLSGGAVSITGLSALTIVDHFDNFDILTIQGLGAADTINASGIGFDGPRLVLSGGDGADIIVGSLRGDTIIGGDGDDFVDGGKGDDTFVWNSGDDNDTVEGRSGIDTLQVNSDSAAANFLGTVSGGRIQFTVGVTIDLDDTEIITINGGGGTDRLTIFDTSGADLSLVIYTGGSDVDQITSAAAIVDFRATGGGGHDDFFTGAGTDVLDGGIGDDTIEAGAGNDILIGGAGADDLDGGAGDDMLRFFAGSDIVAGEIVDGGSGIADTVQLFNTGFIDFRLATFTGIERLQFVTGNSSANFSANQIGSTAIVGGAGTDRFTVDGTIFDLGGLVFSSWNNTVDRVVLVGTAGNDTLSGTNQADILVAVGGTDTLNGRLGNDTYNLAAATATIKDSGGVDTIISTISRSLLASGLSVIENLTLTGAAIANAIGNNGANTLVGNNAINTLDGGLGNDRLIGLGGNDVLIGWAGRDISTGGAGNDIFRFRTASHSPVGIGADVVTDFDDSGNDRIDLSLVFGPALAYRHNLAFTAAGQVRINDIAGADVIVEVNTGGSLAADMQVRLTATALASMTASDFIL